MRRTRESCNGSSDGQFSRYHGIPRTKFSRYQNRQGHGILHGTILSSDWTVDCVL